MKMRLLDNAIAIMFLSFIVGMLAHAMLRRHSSYAWLSSRYVFAKAESYERLGVLWFRWFLLSTPLRYFNPHIRFAKKSDLETLRAVRSCMAAAEVSHWCGAIAMLAVTCIAWWQRGTVTGLWLLLFNFLGNVYPSLLQQYNKLRLQRVMAVAERAQRGTTGPRQMRKPSRESE